VQTNLVLILLVEDDQLIQAMVSEALSDGGFKAEVAVTAEEAAGLLEAHVDRYQAQR
jgi:DNA-binding response OmpR family regulator